MLSIKIAIRSIPLVLLLSGCLLVELLPEPPEHHGSASGEGPSDFQLHAAILSDVRRELLFEQHLQEGRPTCAGVRIAVDKAICPVDGSEMTILNLREDLQYEANRSKETAYFCPKESIYYYRYEGGPRKVDVWLGPYKIPFRSR